MATRLTNFELDFLVAKLQGVKVMKFVTKNGDEHCAEEMEFEPEGSANHYDLKSFKMWKFYEPTKDWSITGPIIEKERINLSTYDEDGDGERGYWGAWYGEYQHEQDGDTPMEAAIRSYIAKHFGDTIDLENLPPIIRTAMVQVDGFNEEVFEEPFQNSEIEVDAETTADAVEKAKIEFMNEFPGHEIIGAHFVRWQ